MKQTETVRAETAPAVSKTRKLKADSIACIYGVELFTLGWIAGMLSAFFGYPLQAALITLAAAGIAAALLRKRALPVLLIAAGLLPGLLRWNLYDKTFRQPMLALDGQTVQCTGTVTEREIRNGDRARYLLLTELAGHRCETEWFADADVPLLQIGDAVTLRAVLTRIRPDFRYHTAERQAGAGRYLRIYDAEVLGTEENTGFSPRRTLDAYRQRMTEKIRAALAPEDAGLLCAMLFGDKTALSDETLLGLNRSGIGHVAVVSGLHLVLFCTAAAWVLRKLQCPARLAFLLQAVLMLLFILLVDASPAVYRAAVMVLLARSAVLFGRHSDPLRALSLAAVGCTAVSPYIIGSVSFWLSVSGVLGIGVIAPYMTAELKCSAQKRTFFQLCCVSAAVFPASVLLCGESSLLGPVCNLLILPVCTAALMLGFAVLFSGGFFAFLLPAAGMLCRFVRFLTGLAGRLPFSHLTVSAKPFRVVLVICTAALCMMAVRRTQPKRLLLSACVSAALLIFTSTLTVLQQNRLLRIALLGAQKTAALVISADGVNIVADLSDSPRNAQYVRAYLQKNGIDRVDALLLKSDRTASAYQAELTRPESGITLLPHPEYLRAGTEVLGTLPTTAAEPELICGGLEIQQTQTGLRIEWNGLPVAADTAPQIAGNAAVIRYGKDGAAVQIAAEPPQEYQGNNLLLCFSKDGYAAVCPA